MNDVHIETPLDDVNVNLHELVGSIWIWNDDHPCILAQLSGSTYVLIALRTGQCIHNPARTYGEVTAGAQLISTSASITIA